MTILSRVVWPGGELTICGMPSKAWLDWLCTTDVPLTADQQRWRNLARQSRQQPPQFDVVDTEEL